MRHGSKDSKWNLRRERNREREKVLEEEPGAKDISAGDTAKHCPSIILGNGLRVPDLTAGPCTVTFSSAQCLDEDGVTSVEV